MAVTFVIGRAGSGKTHRCFDAIVGEMRARPLGPPIYWLLPRQATFDAERRLTCASGLDGFCRTRAISFEQLGEDIFNDCGGAAVPAVTPLGRQMILARLLRRHERSLTWFSSVARQVGLAAELDRTFAELERAGTSAAELATIIDQLAQSGPLDADGIGLQSKLRDIQVLYSAYGEFLGQDRLDQHRRFAQVLANVRHCSLFANTLVYVDGFLDFTDHERRLLAAIARAGARMEITLLMDPRSPLLGDPHLLPDEMGLFHRTEMTYRKLWFAMERENVAVESPVILAGSRRFATDDLQRMEQSFDRDPVASDARDPGASDARGPGASDPADADLRHPEPRASVATAAIERIEAPDRGAEVDAVARRIRLLLGEEHYRLREIAVLAGDLDEYDRLLGPAFEEHGIPYFMDRRRAATYHPLLEFLRAAMHIAIHHWPHDSIMALFKSGLAGPSLDEADELENYVLLHGIRGVGGWESTEPWAMRGSRPARDETDEQQLPLPLVGDAPDPLRIDRLRRSVTDKLLPLIRLLRDGSGTLTVRQVASEIFATFERFSIRATLGSWMAEAARDPLLGGAASRIEQRDEHEQVWSELVALFEQMVELLGDERLRPEEFLEILESGLERFDLALTPPTVDQVLVGQVDRTICPPGVRAVFVLGLNEGSFPARAGRETVLSDRERFELRGRNLVELDPDSHRRQLDERLLAYLAFTRPAERLILSRPAADDVGRRIAPSKYWSEIEHVVPSLSTTVVAPQSDGSVEHLSTPRQLVTALMRWARRSDPVAEDAACAALYQWLAGAKCRNDAVRHVRDLAWRALDYSNDATLRDDVRRALFASPLRADIPQIETFAACPFRHFVRYGLQVRARPDQDLSGRDLGQLYHRALEQLVGDAIRARSESPDGDDPLPISQQQIRAAVRRAGVSLREELMLGNARLRHVLNRVERTLLQVIAAQRESLRRGRFRPTMAGVAFGEGEALPALKVRTPSGAEVYIEGSIDRIDVVEDPDRGDAIAFDYKLAAGPLSLQKAYHGLSLQLLTNLLVLQEAANASDASEGRPLTPAATFALQLLRSLGDVEHPDDAVDPDDPAFLLGVKPRGIFAERCMGDLDRDAAEGRSMVVNAFLNKQGGFGHRNTTDVADATEFAALLDMTRAQVGQLADGIVSGAIDVRPYRLNRETPCPRCEYRPICRFETFVNQYHNLDAMGRGQVLERLREGSRGA